jgi:hypothetical protein
MKKIKLDKSGSNFDIYDPLNDKKNNEYYYEYNWDEGNLDSNRKEWK